MTEPEPEPEKPLAAADLPIGTRVTRPGWSGAMVKYEPGRWAQTLFDHRDAFMDCVLGDPGVMVEVPDGTEQPPADFTQAGKDLFPLVRRTPGESWRPS